MLTCRHCQKSVQRVALDGYCCPDRELDVLRLALDEVTRSLEGELREQRSVGVLDAAPTLEQAVARCRAARLAPRGSTPPPPLRVRSESRV